MNLNYDSEYIKLVKFCKVHLILFVIKYFFNIINYKKIQIVLKN